jgi:hypothetical protein
MRADLEYLGKPRSVVLRCEGECAGEYPRGDYRLTLHQHAHSDSMDIGFSKPVHYTSDPQDHTLKDLGLTCALGGGLLAASGLVSASFGLLPLGVARLFGFTTEYEGHPRLGAVDWYGVVAFPTGFVLGLVGLYLFLSHRKPFSREHLGHNAGRVQLDLSPSFSGAVGSLRVGL